MTVWTGCLIETNLIGQQSERGQRKRSHSFIHFFFFCTFVRVGSVGHIGLLIFLVVSRSDFWSRCWAAAGVVSPTLWQASQPIPLESLQFCFVLNWNWNNNGNTKQNDAVSGPSLFSPLMRKANWLDLAGRIKAGVDLEGVSPPPLTEPTDTVNPGKQSQSQR